jgi:hypothetical protein
LCGNREDGSAQLAGERSGAGSLGSALVVGPKHELDLGRQYDPLEKKKRYAVPRRCSRSLAADYWVAAPGRV